MCFVVIIFVLLLSVLIMVYQLKVFVIMVFFNKCINNIELMYCFYLYDIEYVVEYLFDGYVDILSNKDD